MKLAVLDNGTIRAHRALDDLRRAWKRADAEDRQSFFKEVTDDRAQNGQYNLQQ